MIDVGSDLSPESAYVPYESLNDRQMAITGECFPEHTTAVIGVVLALILVD